MREAWKTKPATMMTKTLRSVMMLMVGCLPVYLCAPLHDAPPVNDRPIIGILAMDTPSPHVHGRTFISATYVKYLEQAGARVVPIRGGQPDQYYADIVSYTNGILFPGGAVPFNGSLIGRSAQLVFKKAIELNQKGDYYPLWGTCMGFQLLCYLVQGQNLLQPTDSNNITWPLNFSKGYMSSRMYGSAPPEILKILSTEDVTQNQHSYSIRTEVFEKSKLSKFFTKLSTNKDRNGTEFISSVEAKDYPIYGVQWHPEKSNFNWNPNYVINHSPDAVRVSQYMSRFFVDQARKSHHKFPSVQEEAKNLIENYTSLYSPDGTFLDLYYIDP